MFSSSIWKALTSSTTIPLDSCEKVAAMPEPRDGKEQQNAVQSIIT